MESESLITFAIFHLLYFEKLLFNNSHSISKVLFSFRYPISFKKSFLKNKPFGRVEISFKGKKKLTNKFLNKLKGEFLNELLNYTVRINLSKHNHKIREYIIGRALLSAVGTQEDLQENELKYQNDPLGIAVPWEEKYGNKSNYGKQNKTAPKAIIKEKKIKRK